MSRMSFSEREPPSWVLSDTTHSIIPLEDADKEKESDIAMRRSSSISGERIRMRVLKEL
jgi:hypothetical protein